MHVQKHMFKNNQHHDRVAHGLTQLKKEDFRYVEMLFNLPLCDSNEPICRSMKHSSFTKIIYQGIIYHHISRKTFTVLYLQHSNQFFSFHLGEDGCLFEIICTLQFIKVASPIFFVSMENVTTP